MMTRQICHAVPPRADWPRVPVVFLHVTRSYLLLRLVRSAPQNQSTQNTLGQITRFSIHAQAVWAQRSVHMCVHIHERYFSTQCLLKVKPDSPDIVFWLAFLPVQRTQTWHSLAASLFMFTFTSEVNICSSRLDKQQWYRILCPMVSVFSLLWPEPWENKRLDRVTRGGGGICGISPVCHGSALTFGNCGQVLLLEQSFVSVNCAPVHKHLRCDVAASAPSNSN